ncbi:MAG: HTTM domain-containing protein [Bacteroidota bacterium]
MLRLRTYLNTPLPIAPLATFRVLFGGIMLVSVLRFVLKGWVEDYYIAPEYYFTYYGFDWVRPLGETGMYALYAVMGGAALLMMLGLLYRAAAVAFFLSFTYVELLDKTYYLNHYYFVSIVAFLLIWVPAHRYFSLDVRLGRVAKVEQVPRWVIGAFRLQLGLVYFFAGAAKLNTDWMLRAQPMRIWLPAHANVPLVGGLLKLKATAYAFSWLGTLYDLSIPFWLLIRRIRPLAYVAVIVFHVMTWLLFPIGMFPWIMILSTLIFFPAERHRRVLERLSRRASPARPAQSWSPASPTLLAGLLVLHFAVQIALPFRHALYPGNLFWHEQGYRFSWRVMLMEKAGYAVFFVRDPRSGAQSEVNNRNYLTPLQEKMMATQPDMILQYAHFLQQEFQAQGIVDPEIRADVHVTLNGSGTRRFIDPEIDLAQVRRGWHAKDWVLPFAPVFTPAGNF